MRGKSMVWVLGFASVFATDVASQQSRTPPELKLVGTATSEDGGFAIVQLSDGAVHFLEVGHETIGYTVVRIERSRIVLQDDLGELAVDLTPPEPSTDLTAREAADLIEIRRDFVQTVSRIYERFVDVRQDGNAIVMRHPDDDHDIAVRIPRQLVGEQFAPNGPPPGRYEPRANPGGSVDTNHAGRERLD